MNGVWNIELDGRPAYRLVDDRWDAERILFEIVEDYCDAFEQDVVEIYYHGETTIVEMGNGKKAIAEFWET